ncbi:hypothetical protein ACEWY4_014828 [Coilia grayii]|uniref:Ig-like domain-containing protein n=1 Tax=Coilia grayii TaxID=363190 RepID=A0ABD1JTK6_9TELE
MIIRLTCAGVLWALLLQLASCIDPSLDAEWRRWCLKFNKPSKQGRSAGVNRREVWEGNYQLIQAHNQRYTQGQETYDMAMNGFGDLTEEEFVERAQSPLPARHLRSTPLMLSASELREAASRLNISSIDYRDMGYITPGLCGSCWAYSATGALEAQWKRRSGRLVPLSKQQLVDCSQPTGNKGCIGGRPSLAYTYVIQNGGIQAEETYPYEMREAGCRANRSLNVVSVKDWKYVPPANEQALEDAVATIGPVAVVIDTTTRNFQFYRRGVFYDPKCSIWKQAHAVLLVGFGSEGSQEYWTIKNSWGVNWGEKGYMRLTKNQGLHCVSWAADTGVAVTRGQSATLQCPLETNLTEGMISWYKQISGEGPNLVLSYALSGYSEIRYGVGFHPDRFSVQPKTNDSQAHQLLISTTEETDSATYYCGISDRNETGQNRP